MNNNKAQGNFVTFPVKVEWTKEGLIKRDEKGKKIVTYAPKNHQKIIESRLVSPGYATAIGCGQRSNLFVIDFDTKDNPLMQQLQSFCPTYTVETEKGFHLYYKYFDGSEQTILGKVPNVDIKSTGGFVFAPPTKGYEIKGELAPAEFTLDHIQAYKRACVKVDRADVGRDLPGINCTESVETIAQKYRALRSGEYEGGRDTYLLKIGDSLMTYFRDDEPKRQAIIREVATNVFINPWDNEQDLARIFTQSRDFIEAKHQADASAKKQDEKKKETSFHNRFTSVQDIIESDLPPIKFNGSGLIVMGKPNMISAHAGAGKSTTIFHWMSSIAAGTKIYDQFPTRKMPVLYIDAEDDRRVVKHNMKRKTFEGSLEHFIYTSKEFGKIELYDKKYLEMLIQECVDRKIQIVVFDSLSMLMQGDDSDQEAVSKFHDILDVFIAKGITPVVIHHNNKGAGTKGSTYSPFDYVRGSTKIQGYYRMMWALTNDADDRIKMMNTKNTYNKRRETMSLDRVINDRGGFDFKLLDIDTKDLVDVVYEVIKRHEGTQQKNIEEIVSKYVRTEDVDTSTINKDSISRSLKTLKDTEMIKQVRCGPNAHNKAACYATIDSALQEVL